MSETRDIRLKRLRMRSWRRGTREMDLILGPYAEAQLGVQDATWLDAYERLLEEPDPDLYAWVTGAARPAEAHREMIDRIRSFHRIG